MRIDDYKYRFIDQPNGWLGGTVKPDWPILINIRLDPFERTGLAGSLNYYNFFDPRVLAVHLRPAGGGEGRRDVRRVPADAEGRQLQPRSREGADPQGRPDPGPSDPGRCVGRGEPDLPRLRVSNGPVRIAHTPRRAPPAASIAWPHGLADVKARGAGSARAGPPPPRSSGAGAIR